MADEKDLLNFADIQHLIDLTAERARAAQESADTLKAINEGQRELVRILREVKGTLSDLIVCSRRVEGVSTAVAAYLANRNGSDLERLQEVLQAVEKDGGGIGAVSVHVDQQAGGVRAEQFKAESDRDVNVAGGNIKEG